MLDWVKVEEQVKEGYISKQRHPSFPLTIYNYTHKAQYDWHWTPETMACRGLIRHDCGRIVSRPFLKFFSVEQLNGNLPDGPFEVFEKIDGSLGVLYHNGEKCSIATRGSFTSEQALWATNYLERHHYNATFVDGWTYLFEIVYPGNRIVVDYGDFEGLILLAVINNETGRDIEPPDIGIPIVKRFDGIKDFSELAAQEEANKEGFVLRFIESGQRVKVKFAEYKRLHKILTGLSARHIWEALQIPDGLAPILERMPDEFYEWVKVVETDLLNAYDAIQRDCDLDFVCMPEGDRKTKAAWITQRQYPAILFKMLDGREYSKLIWDRIYPAASRAFRCDEE